MPLRTRSIEKNTNKASKGIKGNKKKKSKEKEGKENATRGAWKRVWHGGLGYVTLLQGGTILVWRCFGDGSGKRERVVAEAVFGVFLLTLKEDGTVFYCRKYLFLDIPERRQEEKAE